MDKFEAMKVVQDRILELESEQIAKKVTGYLYFRYEEPEIIRLAFGPDILIQNLILKAKVSLPSEAIISPPISPSVNPISIPDPSLQHACFQSPSPLRRSLPPPLDGASHGEFQQTELMKLEDQFEPVNSVASGFSDNFCNEGGVTNISVRHNQHVPNSPEVPIKTCRYFKKGVCKNGNKCRYSHSNKCGYEDQVVTPGSLELLEMEITELLKSIGGSPLSISSLPMLYFERYRRTLKVEGYYPGTNLVKLLARLNNTLKLIYRPDGQHAIMLAEDSGKNLEVRATKSDPGPVNGSRNLFLTFRPESTFTKEDVSKYFSTFGTVQDVRIPCQQKRMFGFVTFASSDTVAVVLAKGNPHLVCGSRVIVKPWKEKPRICERTYDEKLGSVLYSSNHMDNNSEHQSRLHEEQLIEEHKKMLELKMRHLSYMNLSQRQQSPNCDQPYFGRAIQEPRVSKDHNKFPSEQFGCMLNGGRTTDSHHAKINYTYPHSNQEFDYPGNPFA